MKKLLSFVLTIVMVVTMAVAAQAADNAFIISPSLKPAPTLISFKNQVEGCLSEIIITAYANRHTLPDEVRELIETAYETLANTKDVGTLNDGLKALADKYKVSTSDFAVSDLFDISRTECDCHEEHGAFDLVIAPESLKNFVCLLHYYDGKWNIVEDAEVTNNGEYLKFTADEFSPFAIVVNTKDVVEPEKPEDPGKPGDSSKTAVYAVIMLGSALSVVVLARKLKKQSV